jgi:uncharacterized integral membrane protein
VAVVIVLLIVFIIAGIFSIQNAVPVTVTFLSWKFEASLAIVMLLSVLGGIIAGAEYLAGERKGFFPDHPFSHYLYPIAGYVYNR